VTNFCSKKKKRKKNIRSFLRFGVKLFFSPRPTRKLQDLSSMLQAPDFLDDWGVIMMFTSRKIQQPTNQTNSNQNWMSFGPN
jgi:hypothetical protein